MTKITMAIDGGARRIGVARTDAGRIMALPVATLRRERYGGHLDEIVDLATKYRADDFVVGLPLHLSGREGRAAQAAKRLAYDLAEASGIPVWLVDERLTTVQAHADLAAAGREMRLRKDVVDQASAVVLLEHVLETERRTGSRPGRRVDVKDESAHN
ncbi:MAG: Holliday junction resolvase RuvX [Bowdeniella nasicola]|nr:Holliday junction resolvase RuvX [Bowdeniella nasicola]